MRRTSRCEKIPRFFVVGNHKNVKKCTHLGIWRKLKPKKMKKFFLTAIALIALSVVGSAQTKEDIQKFVDRAARLQKLIADQPKACGIVNIDRYAEAVNTAAVFALENSAKLRDFFYREIGETKDGVTDVTVKKPTLDEWISLGTTIGGEGAKVTEATNSAKAAIEEADKAAQQAKNEKNPMNAAKLAKNAKAAAALIAFSKDALAILGEETVEQGKAIQSIIETLKSGKNL